MTRIDERKDWLSTVLHVLDMADVTLVIKRHHSATECRENGERKKRCPLHV